MESVLHFIRSTLEFLVIYVGVRYVLARRIGKWFDKKLDEHPIKYGRYAAILTHHKLRAKNVGHAVKNVLECTDDACATI